MKIVIFPWARKMRTDKPHPKDYPYWKELIKLLREAGHEIIQVGLEGEDQLVDDFRKNLSIGELSELLKGCDTWIGVDSFGQHLGWDLGIRGIVIFGQSDPNIFGHPENINLLKSRSYLREKQFWLWEQAEYNGDAFVEPDVVIAALEELQREPK
jgi:ADP-heptose:LPS heptosyltransferase